MIGYLLPTEYEKYTLWFPGMEHERLAWGELKGLKDKVQVLTPTLKARIDPLLIHDNIFRPVTRSVSWAYRYYWTGRLMLWGVIWLSNIDNPVEDVLGGLYLLLGLPLFLRLINDTVRSHIGAVRARFEALTYSPEVTLVYSKELEDLEVVLVNDGPLAALEVLDELGLQHLREFYKRVAWQERWETPKPTGQGVIHVEA